MQRAMVISVAAALAATASAAIASGAPTMRFTDITPVNIRGTNLRPGEHLRVTLLAGRVKRVRTVRASSTGAFRVDFGELGERDRCGVPMTLTAVGTGRATYKLPPRECPVDRND